MSGPFNYSDEWPEAEESLPHKSRLEAQTYYLNETVHDVARRVDYYLPKTDHEQESPNEHTEKEPEPQRQTSETAPPKTVNPEESPATQSDTAETSAEPDTIDSLKPSGTLTPASDYGAPEEDGIPFADLEAELEREEAAQQAAERDAELEAEMLAELEAEENEMLAKTPQVQKPPEPSTCPCEGLSKPPEPTVYKFGYDSERESDSEDQLTSVPTRNAKRRTKHRPIMKRLEIMPALYHRADNINFYSLAHHVVLDAEKLTFKTLYLNVGLDPGRGSGLTSKIKKYLRIPGKALRLNNCTMDERKRKIVEVAHTLLYENNLGRQFLDQPAKHLKGCKRIRWSSDSTETLLEFSNLLYKVALAEQSRKDCKYKNVRQEPADAGPVQVPATAAVVDYASPQYVASHSAEVDQTANNGQNNKRKPDVQDAGEQQDQQEAQGPARKRRRQPDARKTQKSRSSTVSPYEEIIDLTDDNPPAAVPIQSHGHRPQPPSNQYGAPTGLGNVSGLGNPSSQQTKAPIVFPVSKNMDFALSGVQNHRTGSDLPPHTPTLRPHTIIDQTSSRAQPLGMKLNDFVQAPAQCGSDVQVNSVSKKPVEETLALIRAELKRLREPAKKDHGEPASHPDGVPEQIQPMHQSALDQSSFHRPGEAIDVFALFNMHITSGDHTIINNGAMQIIQAQRYVQGQPPTILQQNLPTKNPQMNHQFAASQNQHTMAQRSLAAQVPQQQHMPRPGFFTPQQNLATQVPQQHIARQQMGQQQQQAPWPGPSILQQNFVPRTPQQNHVRQMGQQHTFRPGFFAPQPNSLAQLSHQSRVRQVDNPQQTPQR